MISYQELRRRQNLPLGTKIELTNAAIQEWYEYWEGQVYISFSGGKDSTVLLDLVRKQYPNVVAFFVDTGLEWPEIRDFVKTIDNVIWLKPKMPFHKVIKRYGYPIISKETANKIYLYHASIRNNNPLVTKKILYGREIDGAFKLPEKWKFLLNASFKISGECCNIMKKTPFKKIKRLYRYVGSMAADSQMRQLYYMKNQCNSFNNKTPGSTPLGFWRTEDIWGYIKRENLSYSKIYDMGYHNTGCMFCMFGVHLEKGNNRFQKMQITHPKLWEYCIYKFGLKEVLETIKVPYKYQGFGLDLYQKH
uniref:Putative phosphoadenosine phosphosulfate n=1 Tax=viral metagenome TaxID=1070528 RepID=A0A6M3KWL5_9ZZZZ